MDSLDRIYTELALHEEYQRANPAPKVSDKMRARSVRGPVIRPKGIGDQLMNVFKAKRGAKTNCQDCRLAILRLNAMTADEIMDSLDEIVAEIATRAPKEAPYLWQRIAVKVDQSLHLGQTEARIREDILEAVHLYKAGLSA